MTNANTIGVSTIIPEKSKKNKRHGHGREFLLTFFDPKTSYQEIEWNGFRLIKIPDGKKGKSKVQISPMGKP